MVRPSIMLAPQPKQSISDQINVNFGANTKPVNAIADS